MIKKILATSLIGLTLFVSGCGDTEGEDRLATQQMLDAGDYEGVIAKLESSASSEDDYITLGAAYMGKAGLSLTSIITSVISSVGEGDSAFSGFVTGISTTASPSALPDLTKAIEYYTKVVKGACLNRNASLTNSQKDICLYIGLASTTSAAVTIDLLAGDITSFGDSATPDDKLLAATCALQYGADDRNDTNVDGNCTIVEGADVNFTVINKIYTDLNVTVNTETYHYLLNDANETVLTKDYCTATDFSTRTGSFVITTPSYYACPINEINGAAEFTTAGVLVNVLNNGIDSIGATGTSDTQDNIDEFKCEILGGSYTNNDCNTSLDVNVTAQNIIDYLNNQN